MNKDMRPRHGPQGVLGGLELDARRQQLACLRDLERQGYGAEPMYPTLGVLAGVAADIAALTVYLFPARGL